MIDLTSQSYFYFIRISIIDVIISLNRIISLAIGETILIGIDVVVGFFELSLW